jgi:hypothetical protein
MVVSRLSPKLMVSCGMCYKILMDSCFLEQEITGQAARPYILGVGKARKQPILTPVVLLLRGVWSPGELLWARCSRWHTLSLPGEEPSKVLSGGMFLSESHCSVCNQALSPPHLLPSLF